MTVDELKQEAMRLDPTERASLARELLVSLDALSEPEVERLWLEEAERRRLLVEAGETQLVPMDEVFAQARARRAS
ncbi:MAG: addiction module protein [Coriobacteriia bacterium]|nr:addiction module protein [Coriobacteriia bacterium]